VHIDAARCKGCELCIDYCPTTILEMSSEFNPKGYHFPLVVKDDCVACQSCFIICPEFAIFATPASSAARLPDLALSR
jgi:2-oxoglutarate ferredoxin oxidoreductase subunit delta